MIIIRPLEKKDLESVNKIFDQYWNDDFRKNLSSKLEKYLKNDSQIKEQKFKFSVAEEDGNIVGIDAIRDLQSHMKEYATTDNPAEWYVAAVKNSGKGIGSALFSQRLEMAKKEGYAEVLLFSGETHKDAWRFHDRYFERVGPSVAPNGEPGYVWRKVL